MAQTKAIAKRRPTRFSMGDWLARDETKSDFRRWQAQEMSKSGLGQTSSLGHQSGQSSTRELGPNFASDPFMKQNAADSEANTLSDGSGRVKDVAVLSDQRRPRVLRLTEEEDFVIDEVAKRVVEELKKDLDWQLLVEIAKQEDDEIEDD